MKIQQRPGFAPGIAPDFARRRTSSGCMWRRAAASVSDSVRSGAGGATRLVGAGRAIAPFPFSDPDKSNVQQHIWSIVEGRAFRLDLLDASERQRLGYASSQSFKWTPKMAAMSRHQPFSRGSSMGAFGQLLPLALAAEVPRERTFRPACRSSGGGGFAVAARGRRGGRSRSSVVTGSEALPPGSGLLPL